MEATYQAGLEALLKKHDPKERLSVQREPLCSPKPLSNPHYVSRGKRRSFRTKYGSPARGNVELTSGWLLRCYVLGENTRLIG